MTLKAKFRYPGEASFLLHAKPGVDSKTFYLVRSIGLKIICRILAHLATTRKSNTQGALAITKTSILESGLRPEPRNPDDGGERFPLHDQIGSSVAPAVGTNNLWPFPN